MILCIPPQQYTLCPQETTIASKPHSHTILFLFNCCLVGGALFSSPRLLQVHVSHSPVDNNIFSPSFNRQRLIISATKTLPPSPRIIVAPSFVAFAASDPPSLYPIIGQYPRSILGFILYFWYRLAPNLHQLTRPTRFPTSRHRLLGG